MTLNQEPFVSADEAAKFLGIKRRFLLSLARQGVVGAYALGTGGIRRVWVFRLSELAETIASKRYHLIHGSPR
jgi:excisionase family DNA binding protein